MSELKAYLHSLALNGGYTMSSYSSLSEWQSAVRTAGAIDDVRILLDVGFSALTRNEVGNVIESREPGAYLTARVLHVGPGSWLNPIELVDGVPEIFRSSGFSKKQVGVMADEYLAAEIVPVAQPRGRGRPRKNPLQTASAQFTPSPREFANFSAYLDAIFSGLSEGAIEVLRARLAFDGERSTLEVIAKSRGVSRARIQQVESGTITHLSKLPETDAMLARLSKLESECAEPVRLADIPKLDIWFDAASVNTVSFIKLVRALGEGALDFVEIGGCPYLVPFSKSEWDQAVKRAQQLMRELSEAEMPVAKVGQELVRILSAEFEKYLGLLWQDAAGDNAQIAMDANEIPCLVAFGQGANEALKAVLFEADGLLHRDEAVSLARTRTTRQLSDATIANALAEVGLLFARGYYGSRRHIPLSDDEISQVVAAAEEVVYLGPEGRQWANEEICREIDERNLFDHDRLDPYLVGVCLRLHGTSLDDQKRGIWSAGGERIQIRDFAIDVIREAGRPLSTEEIKAALVSRRGIQKVFQIHPKGELVRVGKALWGLIDRDLGRSPQEITLYMDVLKAHLLRTGKGLHSSEVGGVLARAGIDVDWLDDPELLLALAEREPEYGMRVTHARYLALSGWADERRITPRKAVEEAVSEDPSRTAVELALDASERAGREISPDSVRYALNSLGFAYNKAESRWVDGGSR